MSPEAEADLRDSIARYPQVVRELLRALDEERAHRSLYEAENVDVDRRVRHVLRLVELETAAWHLDRALTGVQLPTEAQKRFEALAAVLRRAT